MLVGTVGNGVNVSVGVTGAVVGGIVVGVSVGENWVGVGVVVGVGVGRLRVTWTRCSAYPGSLTKYNRKVMFGSVRPVTVLKSQV